MNELVFALLAQTLIHVYTFYVEQKSVEFIDTCTHTHTCTRTHARTHTHTCTRTHARTHTHTHWYNARIGYC